VLDAAGVTGLHLLSLDDVPAFDEAPEIGATFPRTTLDKMLDAALAACDQLFVVQREALDLPYPGELPEPKTPAKKAFGS
jgi:hypothetical protein